MSCLHTHSRHRFDPTRTQTLRKKFEQEAARRMRWLKGRIREAIVEDDGFGLKTNRGRFEFERSADSVAAFMGWLREQMQEGVLEVQPGMPMARAAQQAWTSVYIETAYQRGIAQGAGNMRKAGANVEQRWIDSAFNRPIHADRVGLIYIRAYEQLEGITEAMSQQISRVLAEGIAEGRNPLDIARLMNDRVDKIGLNRVRTFARTEVINAHAEASLNAYEEAGLVGVEAQAEFSTAGDDRVCPECASLEESVWLISEAHGIIPVHPNCRCVWIPSFDGVNVSAIDLR